MPPRDVPHPTDDRESSSPSVSATLLGRWGNALARTGRANPEIVARALGITLRPGWLGYAEATDPPAGVAMLVLALDEGLVQWVSVQLDGEQPVTVAEIEAAFGAGDDLPVMHPDQPRRRSHRPIVGTGGSCLPVVDSRDGRAVEVTYVIGPPTSSRPPRSAPDLS